MERNKAYFIAVGAEPVAVTPANGRSFTYEELKNFIQGSIQIVPLPSGKCLVCDDNGRLDGLEMNEKAMELWAQEYPRDKYPMNNDGVVVGPVLIAPKRMVR